MKPYISVDIEGVAGITDWSEATPTDGACPAFQHLMTQETLAACQGALAAGATEIFVKDAHWFGRNLKSEDLPAEVTLIRGWSGSPLFMVQELDNSFTGAAFIGWHARAGSEGNPLAHTGTTKINEIRLNGEPMSEFGLHVRMANALGVPVVFISGDEEICAEAHQYNAHIQTCPLLRGIGASTVYAGPHL